MSPFAYGNKPSGVPTHSPEAVRKSLLPQGYVEWLAARNKQNLYVCHRLDKETSGAIVFATAPESAAFLNRLFAERKVEKTYWFVTDRFSAKHSFEVSSHICKVGNTFRSLRFSSSHKDNSLTLFTHLHCEAGFHLWQARPVSGKPHQIRLHAADMGLSVLGDTLHGGTPFPTLMLHSKEIKFAINPDEFASSSFTSSGSVIRHHCEAPLLMHQIGLCRDKQLALWLAAVDRRLRLFDGNFSTDCYRLIHSEAGPLRCDSLGEVTWLSWTAASAPSERDISALRSLMHLLGRPTWHLQFKQDRGRNPHGNVTWQGSRPIPRQWQARELDVNYEFRSDSGLSSGLFLDQRLNRDWVRLWVRERRRSSGHPTVKVLNLFCYSGGFSVCAALAGATQVTSVDTSYAAIDWAKQNFALNSLDSNLYEFWVLDAREFLKLAIKKGRKFDLIVCDPPSFARNKNGVFKLEQDLPALFEAMLQILGVNGCLLISTNYEKWTQRDLIKALNAGLESFEKKFKIARALSVQDAPGPDWDFELPRQPKQLKSAIVR